MFNVRLVIQYDGSRFHGWQVQPNARTVQAELQRVLRIVTKQEIRHVQSSGRTDSGVHARAQVCNFMLEKEVDLDRLKVSVSGILKNEVSVLKAEYVDLKFNSLRDAKLKQYSYTILNRAAPPVLDLGKVVHITRKLDPDILRELSKKFLGEHDFQSFRAADCCARTSVRIISSIELEVKEDYFIFRIEGRGFLKNMVRIIVGTIIDLAMEKLTLSIEEIFEQKNRRAAGRTAPAHGLCLEWVRYQEHS